MQEYVPRLSEGARRWVRFGILVAALLLLCWLAYRLRTVFTPLLIGAAIAYIFNPLVTWLEHRRRVPRLATVIVIFTLLGMLVTAGGIYMVSKTATQITEFQERLPAYLQTIGGWISDIQARVPAMQPAPAAAAIQQTQPATQPASGRQNWWQWAAPSLQAQGIALARTVLNYLGETFANLADVIALLVLVPVFTFYFLWRFNDLVQVIRDHLPAAYRAEVVHVVRTIDEAVASFFRGRLIICLIVGVLTAVGWSIVGVPYSVLLGLLTGVLNLVPGLSLLALPLGLLFTFLSVTQAGGPWLWPVTFTMLVFLAVQGLDAFVLNPLIARRTSGLHVLVIVVALLIGAHLGGLLGLLLAIPVASTLKTLAAEWVLPELRRLARRTVTTDDPGASS
jgi:predicted PurR-regulated permease PerM